MMNPRDLLLIGLGLVALGVALSLLAIVLRSRKYGWNIVSHELGKRSGKFVPRWVSLIYVVGLGAAVVGAPGGSSMRFDVLGLDAHCYRIHDTTGDDLGHIEHPAPNVEPGEIVILEDGREALVTARVEKHGGPLAP